MLRPFEKVKQINLIFPIRLFGQERGDGGGLQVGGIRAKMAGINEADAVSPASIAVHRRHANGTQTVNCPQTIRLRWTFA
jgi:hypothetical protein